MNRLLSLIGCLVIMGAQAALAASDDSSWTSSVVWFFILFMILALSILIGDNMVRAQARLGGIHVDRDDSSFFPGLRDVLGFRTPSIVEDGDYHRLKKGYNIQLEGEAENRVINLPIHTYAVQPGDFRGIRPIPKMLVEVGDEVSAGDALFFDKGNPDILYCAPVSGEIIDIKRGDKRAIAQVIILADKEQRHKTLPAIDPFNVNRSDLVAYLMSSGFWPHINQRPFDVVADPDVVPRDIFISTFDTAPLATDLNRVVEGHEDAFQFGLNVLSRLTSGQVHLGLDARGDSPHHAFANAQAVKKHWFNGPHPSGNVGIQIHHVAPIKSKDIVWTLTVEDVIALGYLFIKRQYRPERLVAVTGNSLSDHYYVRTSLGAKIGEMVAGMDVDATTNRFISGDVLSGTNAGKDGFLHARDNQITVIPEGKTYEMFGWLLPSMDRPSVSYTYMGHLFPNLKYDVDTNTHGERRAFVQTGQYESMLPADIYLQHLMKAILTNDVELMEGLGILELSEEDIALCEFACTSKQPLQKILRDGLDMMREQL